MKETQKATMRRLKENDDGNYPWREIFTGEGADIGAGDNPLPFPNCVAFDIKDGDANKLSQYFKPKQFDYLHASQLVEHLHNPKAALQDWLTLVKLGGHIVFSVPDFDLYEKRAFPSKFNGDHKAVFSLWRKGFPGIKPFYHLPTMLLEIEGIEVRRCELITTNYDWNAPETLDQTFDYNRGVECFLEAVLRKLP